jgi:DNA-binding SARP family transcriptional activator/tetratricopeptide (TPR) repeat protein
MRGLTSTIRPRFAGRLPGGKIPLGPGPNGTRGAPSSRWPPRDGAMPGSQPSQRDFRIDLFGGPSLRRKGRPIHLSPFHGLFLSILAYHGRRGIRRERLISFLWSAGSEAVLRRRLSQIIYSLHLRLATSELIISDGDRFYLDVDRVEPDLERFHTALQERNVEAALQMLSLGFLSEVNPIPTPDLEAWMRGRVRQFRADIRTAAARLWGESEQRGDWERATGVGRVLLKLDPDDEATLRKLIRALGLTAQVAEARAALNEFTERARSDDGGWKPEEETDALVARLDTLARERGPTFLVGRYGLPTQPPLVGREQELATLGRLLRDPPDGNVLSIGLVGEPGVGKTRLAWEALRTLPFDGARVLAARCSEFERRIPLSPFTSALKPGWVGEEARNLEDPWRAVLLGLFPEWHRGPDAPPAVPQIEPREVPRRLCEAFRQLFIGLSRTDPLVLFIDDFHWADETSLSVLDYIRNRGVGGDFRVLVAESVGSPSERSGGLGRGLRWSRGDGPCLRLRSLSVEDVDTLLSLLPAESQGYLDAVDLWALSSGNPSLLAEALAALEVTRARGRSNEPILAHLRPLVDSRLADLSTVERRAFQVLVLAEVPVRVSDLANVLTSPLPDAAAALDRLVSLGWVAIGPDGAQTTSTVLRRAVLETVPTATVVLLHAAIAEALMARADRTEPWAIAHHLIEAQSPESAKKFALSAADEAAEWGYFGEIEELLRRLLRVMFEPNAKQEISTRLGELQFARGDFGAALESLSSAWQLRLRTAPDHPGTQEMEVKILASDLYTGRVSPADGWSRARVLEERVRSTRQMALLPQLYAHVLRSAQHEGDVGTARSVFSRARDLLRSPGTDEGLEMSLNLLLGATVFYENAESALTYVKRAIALGNDGSRCVRTLEAHQWHMIVLHHLGQLNLPEGIEGRRTALRAAAFSGDILRRSQIELNSAVWFVDTFQPEAAEISLSKVEALIGADSLPQVRVSWLVNLGELRLQQRRWEAAAECFRDALTICRFHRSATAELLSRAGLGLCALGERNLSAAESAFERLPRRPTWWTCDPTLVQTFRVQFALRAGDLDQVVSEAEDIIEQVKDRSLMWHLRLCLLVEEVRAASNRPVDQSRLAVCREQAAELNLPELSRRFGDLTPHPKVR